MARKSQAEKPPLTCVVCGSQFFRRGSAAITCSTPCRKARRDGNVAEWRRNNSERVSASCAAYRKRNPEKCREMWKKYRASKRGRQKRLAALSVYKSKYPHKANERRNRYQKKVRATKLILETLVGKEKLNELLAGI
jgi:hypothetical protein